MSKQFSILSFAKQLWNDSIYYISRLPKNQEMARTQLVGEIGAFYLLNKTNSIFI